MTTSPPSPGTLAAIACALEATARKPGNVHPRAAFADMAYPDFVLSALAIGPPLDRAPGRPLGETILDAVAATRSVVDRNTNLGMILLLAPLAAIPWERSWQSEVAGLLDETTVDDSRAVYRAIRLAAPGGLGEAADQDIADEPTLPLRAVMALAADRDLIARQYANGFADIDGIGRDALARHLGAGRPLEATIILTLLAFLAELGDSLIARKCGQSTSDEARARARDVLDRGWPESEEGCRALESFDAWLRADGHRRNPGSTADLTAAALFVALRDGTIPLPISTGPSPWPFLTATP
jgi:triphosphoribosyl-dephospho-CoA synthase